MILKILALNPSLKFRIVENLVCSFFSQSLWGRLYKPWKVNSNGIGCLNKNLETKRTFVAKMGRRVGCTMCIKRKCLRDVGKTSAPSLSWAEQRGSTRLMGIEEVLD